METATVTRAKTAKQTIRKSVLSAPAALLLFVVFSLILRGAPDVEDRRDPTPPALALTPTPPAASRNEKVRNIFWIHVQKTGTSIFNTIFLHFCPRVVAEDPDIVNGTKAQLMDQVLIRKYPIDEFCDAEFFEPSCPGCHHPYKPDDDGGGSNSGQLRHYFTMLRDPMNRLNSAYSYYKVNPAGKQKNVNFDSLETYVNDSHIPNCMLKMILGYDCFHDIPPDDVRLNVSLALERVSSPRFFFGNTDRWAESVCLFHKWYGGIPRAFEMMNNRKTKRTMDLPREQNIHFSETDFYNGAMKVFDTRLRRAGCLNYTLGV